jgi:metal-responsive CopG/Arc/MetJ family transcriptional regulator
MGRPKLKLENKKIKLGITITREINELINKHAYNKSEFIELIIKEYFKNYQDGTNKTL